MCCERWKTKAFPFIEGTLDADERRDYAVHLEGCRTCESEVAASRLLCSDLRELAPIEFSSNDEAALFDAAVMARVAPVNDPLTARQQAAESISLAARRGLARRRFEPLFAPIPSFIGLALAVVAGSAALALLFGQTAISMLGGTFAAAAGSIWMRASWLIEEALGHVVELMTVVEVSRAMFSHIRPWLEAWNLLLATRGQEVMVVSTVTFMVISLTVWKIRRARRRDRVVVRSS